VENPRIYGESPYGVTVIHGGPGARGGLTPVARKIAEYIGVLEPIQTTHTVNGQVDELHDILSNNADLPVTLIGFSWGAWLSFITAARYPEDVKKLILVGCGPFEQEYAARITMERINRLNEADRLKALELAKAVNEELEEKAGQLFGLFHDVDVYERISMEKESDDETVGFDYDIFRSVWPEAERMRMSGVLLKLGEDIRCPVVAIHGDYDPHPAEGVREPLSRVLRDFRFILLEKCGHDPQIEKYARDRFYAILKEEILNTE
jgi:pimeloyl-ACP methyl ester carboxylesterase